MTMPDGYSVKINRRDGALEITGDDKAWVDAKLKELSAVWSEPVGDPTDPAGGDSGSSRGRVQTAKRKAPAEAATSEGATGRRRAGGGGGGGRVGRNEELATQLTPDVRKTLAAYVKERQAAFDKTQPQAAAIIAWFLRDNLGMSAITASDLYTVYAVMGWRTPRKPRAALDNAKARDNFFSVSRGSYTLTHHGENYGRHDSLNSAQTE